MYLRLQLHVKTSVLFVVAIFFVSDRYFCAPNLLNISLSCLIYFRDEERNETTSGNVSTGFRSHSIDAAPEVEPLVTEERRKCQSIVGNRTRNRSYVTYNAPAKQIFAPILGPPNPIDRGGMSSIERNTWTGRAEDAHLSSFAFDSQYHAFDTTGRANDPGMKTSEVVLKTEAGNSLSGVASSRDGDGWASRKKPRKERDFLNTEVTPASFRLVSRQPWADKEPNRLHGIEAENLLQETEEHKVASIVPKGTAAIGEEQSNFHGDVEVDYQGRSWIDISAPEVREAPVSFGPRRQIHTWTGHTKGVNAIRFFPNSGHLLLSAGLDGKIKIWSTSGTRRCMRTYHGHTKGVRGTAFSCDGQQFVSFAYDKAIKCWDTETGKVVCRLGDGQTMAYCASLHPDPSQKETLLVGMQNKKIVQYDLRTSDVVQEYDYHLGPVNSVTFVDDNRRFISTSGMSLSNGDNEKGLHYNCFVCHSPCRKRDWFCFDKLQMTRQYAFGNLGFRFKLNTSRIQLCTLFIQHHCRILESGGSVRARIIK